MGLFRRIVSLGRRSRVEREIDAELREHMAMCVDDNMAQGMSREAAQRDGVMSYTVTERRTEIGIRMALGAQRTNITAMILGKAATLLAAGLVLGAGLSLAAASTAGSLLFGLKPRDPATLAGAALLLAVVTVAASLIPSVRAANVNPIDSLRTE
jgi:predicted lysophospholipase L1 biosynthesis ABC-type transport system permease subunit